jgi:WD40 repeat protein
LFTLLTLSGVVGWGVFTYVRQQPRCIIPASGLVHLTDDGSRLLTADNGQVKVWDTRRGTLLQTFLEPSDNRSFEMLPDMHQVLVTADDTFTFLDWHDGTAHALPMAGWRQQHGYIRISPGGKWLAALQDRDDRRTWAFIDTDRREVVLQGEYPFHAFCGDTGLVVLGKDAPSGVAIPPVLLDLRTGKTLALWPHGPTCLAHSPDGKLLAVCIPKSPLGDKEHVDLSLAYAELVVEVWDVSGPKRIFRHETLPNTCIARAKFTPDGRYLAVVTNDRDPGQRLTLFDLASGGVRFTTAFDTVMFELAFQPDPATGDWLCLVDEHWLDKQPRPPNRVSMWNTATGERLWVRQASHCVQSVPDFGKVTFFAESDQFAIVEARSGTMVAQGFCGNRCSVKAGHVLLMGGLQEADASNWLSAWLQAQWPVLFGQAKTRELVTVIETSTGRQLLQLDFATQIYSPLPWEDSRGTVYHTKLSNTGTTLLICLRPMILRGGPVPVELPAEIRCFDVSPQRACTWAVGSAVSTALGLLLLGVRWRRWHAQRHRQSPGSPVYSPAIRP